MDTLPSAARADTPAKAAARSGESSCIAVDRGWCFCHFESVQAIDFTNSGNHSFLLTLKEANALPEWLKEMPSEEEVKALPTGAFADTSRRLMPIHSKAAAFLSAASSFVYGTEPGPWEQRLKVACHAYQIDQEVERAIEALRPTYQTKEAADNQKGAYALTVSGEGYYPIDNEWYVEKSASQLADDYYGKRLPEAVCNEVAIRIVKAANELGMKLTRLPEIVRSFGEERTASPEFVQKQAALRASLGGHAEYYEKVAEAHFEGKLDRWEAIFAWEMAD
jgi:hypothetical protein